MRVSGWRGRYVLFQPDVLFRVFNYINRDCMKMKYFTLLFFVVYLSDVQMKPLPLLLTIKTNRLGIPLIMRMIIRGF